MKCIPADKLIAEIERRKNERIEFAQKRKYSSLGNAAIIRADEDEDILSIIESLQQEQPQVDLEKEIEEHVKGMPMSEFTHESEIDEHWGWAREEFRYFFGLGLNAKKEERQP